MNWYIGQKVVCVHPNARTKGVVHIHEILVCPKCNLIYLTISEWAKKWPFPCTDCNDVYLPHNRAGTNEKHFRPLEENFAERTLNKAIEQAEEILEIIETVHPVDKTPLQD